MQQVAAVRTVKQAARILKHMNLQGPEWAGIHEARLGAVRDVLHQRMQERVGNRLSDLAALGVRDRRNGSYGRHLLTSMGTLELQVPRTRTFSAVSVIEAYARREPWVDRVILGCFVFGLSTRKVGEALLPILGERVSAATVSRVAQVLDEAVAAFHRRPLTGTYQVLVLDGVVLKRRSGVGALRRPVLVALGMTPEGKKEILDFRLAPGESQPAWEAFLTDLEERGLKAAGLKLIVTDGGTGLLAALPTVYPGIPVQRCWAHKGRNVLDKVREADHPKVQRDLNRISHAEHRTAARRAARRFAERWQRVYPAAVRCLLKDLEELLEFFCFSDLQWRKATRTTNAIERQFVEVRRRTRPMGVFGDRTSIERILLAVFLHENRKQGIAAPFPLNPVGRGLQG
ncbi:MAG TPA: IS256 family transposase [Gemmatimonadales bacterium]|jgi:transposase-like protein|nr:IS256 family transposase [Gemmatimonadales bacterium]